MFKNIKAIFAKKTKLPETTGEQAPTLPDKLPPQAYPSTTADNDNTPQPSNPRWQPKTKNTTPRELTPAERATQKQSMFGSKINDHEI